MKKTKLGLWLVFTTIIILIALLAGCAKTTPTPTPAPKPSPAPTATTPPATTPTAKPSPSPTPTATPAQKFSFKFGHHMATSYIQHEYILKFADAVKQRTNGQVEITVFPNAQISTWAGAADDVVTGRVDFSVISGPISVKIVPAEGIWAMPFLLRDYKGYMDAGNGGIEAILAKEWLKRNIVYLSLFTYGWLGTAGSKTNTIRLPADIKGKKIRTSVAEQARQIELLGGAPSSIASGEVYMALQLGTLDGLSMPPQSFYANKLYEVAKNFDYMPWMMGTSFLGMNKASWDKLPANLQKIVNDTMHEIMWTQLTTAFEQFELKALDDMKAKGVDVYKQTPEERATWMKALATWGDEYVKQAGPIGKDLIAIAEKYNK